MPQAVNPPVMYYQGTPYGLGGVTMVDKHSVMTMLYSRESGDSEDVITLSEDFDNFDLLIISGQAYVDGGLWHQSNCYICDSLSTGNRIGIGDDGSISWFTVTDKSTLTRVWNAGNAYQITYVMGVKFNGTTAGGGKGGVDYSFTEQDTGLKWVDGRSIYQKTVYIQEIQVAALENAPFSIGLSSSDADLIISRESVVARTADGNLYVDNAVTPLWGEGSFGFYRWWVENGQWVVEIDSGYYALQDMYLTIRYVKPLSS